MEKMISISDAAKYLDVTTRTLRYYEEIGLITSHQEGRGKRYYSRENIKKLMYINELKEKGCPLKEIEDLFGGKCCNEKFTVLRNIYDENLNTIQMLKEQNEKIQMELEIIDKLGNEDYTFEVVEFKKSRYNSIRERIPVQRDREIEAIWDFSHNSKTPIGKSANEVIYVMEENSFKEKKWDLFDYIYLKEGKKNSEIEAGKYLVMYTRNSIYERKSIMEIFSEYVEKNSFNIEGPLYMFPRSNILCKSKQEFLVVSEFRMKLV